jgi:hypothetical protein
VFYYFFERALNRTRNGKVFIFGWIRTSFLPLNGIQWVVSFFWQTSDFCHFSSRASDMQSFRPAMSNSIFVFATFFYYLEKSIFKDHNMTNMTNFTSWAISLTFQEWIKQKNVYFSTVKSKMTYIWEIWKQSHSPHSNGHSSLVASGE